MNTVVGKNGVDLPEDIFERSKLAQEMCGAIMNMSAKEYFPVVIDGPWGSGKTVHAARMMKCFADKHSETVKCIYWNAADTDYASEPLSMFISALYSNITEDKLKHKGQQIIKACGELLVSRGGSVAQKMVISYLSGILGVDISSVCNVITELINKSSAKNETELRLEGSLNDCKMEKTPLENAKYLIEQVKDDKKELIIIIDELDRCRPDYALKTLEIIKHLFAIESCKFVLVMNKELLAASVKHLYGFDDENAGAYLNKYIKMVFRLPAKIKRSDMNDCVKEYYLYYLKNIFPSCRLSESLISEYIDRILLQQKIQLREVEKHVKILRFLKSVDESVFGEEAFDKEFSPVLLMFVSYIIAFKNDIACRLVVKKIKHNEVMALFKSRSGVEIESNSVISCVNYLSKVVDCYLANDNDCIQAAHRGYERDSVHPKVFLCGMQHLTKWLSYYSFFE